MPELNNSLAAWLNRPYFDLGPINDGALHLQDIELSYHNLVTDSHEPYVLSVYIPAAFRRSLLRQTGLFQYDIEDPLRLPKELRSERWQRLCDYMSHYDELEEITRLNAVTLLKSLCLHKAVVAYIPDFNEAQIANNPFLAALALRRAMSNLMLQLEAGKIYNRNEFEVIANNAPFGSAIKIGAAMQCIVQDARLKNVTGALAWRARAFEEIERLKSRFDEFNYGLLMSLFYRASGLVTLLTGDREKLVDDMNRCEAYGVELMGYCKEARHEILAEENRNTVMESRTKEAMWLQDFELAEERARKLVEFDPLNSKYHIELADVLAKRNNLEEAAAGYHAAGRMGPPMTEVAWFMAGQAYESLGDLEAASDCYQACLQIDPKAICAAERLSHVSKRLGQPGLRRWSQTLLNSLQGEENASKLSLAA